MGRIIGEKGALKSGGSVAHTAFQLALEMGADPVIFVGLDLAFTGGQSHAAHSIYNHISYTPEQLAKMTAVDGVDGQKVYTSRDMWSMIVMLEKMLTECKTTIIDATEGGALKRGMKTMTFRAAFDTYCREPFPVSDIIRQCYGQRPAYDLAKIKTAVQTMIDDVQQLHGWAVDGETACKRLAKQMLKKKGHDALKVAAYVAEANRNYQSILGKKDMTELLDIFLMRITHQAASTKKLFDRNAKVEKGERAEDVGRRKIFFTGIQESCDFYSELFKKSLEKIKQEFGQ
jgi:hypothetical protein